MSKKSNKKHANPEPSLAEQRINALKIEIAQAMIQRNTLPKSATDEEHAAAAERVEQLQAQHHEAVQHALAIKREETAKLEREHKEKKLRQKRLRASRQPGSHEAPHEEPATPSHHTSIRSPMDRAAEEAQMDAANEEDVLLERMKQEEEDRESAEELAHQRIRAEKKRKKEEAAKRRDAMKREKKEEEAKSEAASQKAEKDALAKIRQQAALQRAEESKAKKRQQHAEREARQREAQDSRPSEWFSKTLQQLKTFFGGSR